jgi:hypothetical protein
VDGETLKGDSTLDVGTLSRSANVSCPKCGRIAKLAAV